MGESWGVIPATLYPQSGEGQAAGLKDARQAKMLGQPSYDEKRMDKDESLGMLPGDKTLYIQMLSQANAMRKQARSERIKWFMDHENQEPSQELTREWNKKILEADSYETQAKIYESLFKQRMKEYDAHRSKLISGDEKSTATRIAVVNQNGVWTGFFGKKEAGGIGLLNQRELLESNVNVPGVDQGGAKGLFFPVSTGYTGAFYDLMQKRMKNTSENYEGSRNGETFGTSSVTYLERITKSSNEEEIKSALNNFFTSMEAPAKEDLMSRFHEDLYSLVTSKNDKGEEVLAMPFGIPDQSGRQGALLYTPEQSDVLEKYVTGKGLTGEEMRILKSAQDLYARQSVMAFLPEFVTTKEKVDHVKIYDEGKDGSTGTSEYTGFFGGIPTGDTEPYRIPGTKEVFSRGTYFNNNGRGNPILKVDEATPGLKQYVHPNTAALRSFNESAYNMYINGQGVSPSDYSPESTWYLNDKGIPSNMQYMKDAGAKIIGFSGIVKEVYAPATTTDDEGSLDYKPFDLASAKPEDRKASKRYVAKYTIAIPDGSIRDFRKAMNDLEDGEVVRGTDLDRFMEVEADGNRPKYYTAEVWLPVREEDFAYLDSFPTYATATGKSQRKKHQVEVQDFKILARKALDISGAARQNNINK